MHKPLFSNALGNMQCPQEHLKTIVYAKFGGQTKCIMGNSKIENSICRGGVDLPGYVRKFDCWKPKRSLAPIALEGEIPQNYENRSNLLPLP